MTDNTLPWVTYQRVSTDEQAREGVSLDMQREACRHLAAAGRYQVAEDICDPGFSAKDLKRPGMRRLLELVQGRQVAGVIIYKLDRLTRNQRDLYDLVEMFNRLEIALISVSEQIHTGSAQGRMFISLIGVFSQWERETIAERVASGMHHRKAQGGYVGGKVPAGMRAVGAPGARVLEVHPVEGPVVSQVWPMIIAGKTLRMVGLALDRAHITCKGTGGWSLSAVHGLVRNKRYIGYLVTEDEFRRAQEALATRSCPSRRATAGGKGQGPRAKASRVWLLSGIARCSSCGSALVGVSATSSTGRLYHYYRCTGRVRRGKGHCAAVDLSADRWEPAVVEAFVRLVGKEGQFPAALVEVQQRLRQAVAPLTDERKKLVMALDKVRAEMGRLTDLAASGAEVAEAVGQGLKERQVRAQDLERQIGSLSGRIAMAGISDEQLQQLIEVVRENVGNLSERSADVQQGVLRTMLRQVVLRPRPRNKEKGEVDLSIDLPSLVRPAFARPSCLVDLSGIETNDMCFSLEVATTRRKAG